MSSGGFNERVGDLGKSMLLNLNQRLLHGWIVVEIAAFLEPPDHCNIVRAFVCTIRRFSQQEQQHMLELDFLFDSCQW